MKMHRTKRKLNKTTEKLNRTAPENKQNHAKTK